MTETKPPSLVTNPASDHAFRAAADAALETSQSIGDFQRILREGYPRTVVRARELSGEQAVVWYVYREGHWVTGTAREE